MKVIFDMHGNPGETQRVTASDIAQTLDDVFVDLINSQNRVAMGVLITCEDNNIRFCLGGATPTQGAAGTGHVLFENQSLRLSNSRAIRTFEFINYTNGADAVLQVTPEFNIGE